MKLFLELPYDASGYGDFGVSYIGTEATIHFQYRSDGAEHVGELRFGWCLSININGQLDKQISLPYDRVMVLEDQIGFDKKFLRFVVMFSGSDFQFDVYAKECRFDPDVRKSDLIPELG
ncbi:hypothetical protein IFT66_08560 [Rhizobium sp. CFBP 13726]|uniref:hypothetical protein n=1 Tax=Rhizobium sp. CFBP 13726 TaxID=2775296 RepID=UPI00177B0272|nr:hypothetical protein [Rhizobium sp. CFBP 13726]MBD8651125.1 hypothetical protein [Rhizobium sp. CFBP 13726]